MSRPLVSASRYELIASGPAFVSAFTGAERSLSGKYRIDRKLVVVSPAAPKLASVASLLASATAIALLVVPKSKPITGCISKLDDARLVLKFGHKEAQKAQNERSYLSFLCFFVA